MRSLIFLGKTVNVVMLCSGHGHGGEPLECKASPCNQILSRNCQGFMGKKKL